MDEPHGVAMGNTFNIHSRSQNIKARMLSPLYNRPFELEYQMFASFEGFFNGIKFPKEDPRRRRAFASSYGYAQRFGNESENKWVWWPDKQFPFGSLEHIEIVKEAHRASILQNDDLKQVLVETGGLVLTHKIETQEDPIYTENMFCETLMQLRSELVSAGFASCP